MVLSILLATFLAGAVESIETFTVVLATGLTRNWKSAYLGLLAGILTLAVAILLLGKMVMGILPLHLLNVVIGLFLFLFGSRWLVKSIQRYGGLKKFRDEREAFEKTFVKLSHSGPKNSRVDRVALSITYGATVLEGSEVAFTVVSFGSFADMMKYAVIGSATGIIAVALLGFIFRRPLQSLPENGIKYVVGVMLTALGTLWTAEGVGVQWILGKGSYFGLLVLYLLFSLILIVIMKSRSSPDSARAHSFSSDEGAKSP